MENQVIQNTPQEPKFKFPSETIELPSKGFFYPEDSPLSNGTIEMKYMTAREEDILSNQNFIKKGVVLDKLLQSLIVTKFDYGELLIGDKNALLIASRILGYGKEYSFQDDDGELHEVDLTELEPKEFDTAKFDKGKNEFFFTLPHSGTQISYKFLTHSDETKIDREIEGLKKINKNVSPELTTRLKFIILSIGGDYEKKTIREFVDNYMLARDSRALRNEIKANQPDVNLAFFPQGGSEEIQIPIGLNFFWPDY